MGATVGWLDGTTDTASQRQAGLVSGRAPPELLLCLLLLCLLRCCHCGCAAASHPRTPAAAAATHLSPRVSAPRLCSRRATAATKRRSPPTSVNTSLYTGAETWLLQTRG